MTDAHSSLEIQQMREKHEKMSFQQKKNMSRHFCFSTPKDFLFSASIISYTIPFCKKEKKKNTYAYIIFDWLPIFYEMSV